MHPHSPDGDRTTVAVVSGVIDDLKIGGNEDVVVDFDEIISFADFFRGVMGETSVADQEPVTAGGKIGAMVFGQLVDGDRDARDVVGAAPPVPFESQAQ